MCSSDLLDSSRAVHDSTISALDGRMAAERLALRGEVAEKDAAVAQRERQLGAQTVAMAQLRLERDDLQIRMRWVTTEQTPDQVDETQEPSHAATFEADSAGIHAEVTIDPGPPDSTLVQLRLSFEPVDVLAAFMEDEEGRIQLLAIADSIHSVVITAPPVFQAPPSRGWFNLDIPLGNLLATGLACGSAGGVGYLLGLTSREALTVGGSCLGVRVGVALAF